MVTTRGWPSVLFADVAHRMTGLYRLSAFATLAVRDVASAAGWYQEVLGFRVVLQARGSRHTPGLAHLRLGQYQDLLLVPAFAAFFDEDKREPGGGVRLTYRVEENVEELAAKFVAAGAHVVEGPVDKPWNAREVTIEDPDGYRLTFSNFSWVSGIA